MDVCCEWVPHAGGICIHSLDLDQTETRPFAATTHMKAKDQSRFSIDALRDLAGDTVFARGEAYHRGGQVQILTIEPKRVLAQVAGSEDYRTELTGRGRNIGGHSTSRPSWQLRV